VTGGLLAAPVAVPIIGAA